MGGWDVFKRLVKGEPAFVAPEPDKKWDDDDDAPTDDYAEERAEKRDQQSENVTSLYNEKGHKQIPIAEVTNVESKQNGDHIELWATVKNQSDREIMLDKIELLGTKFIMDYPLKPGSQRVFRVYSGPQLKHGSYKKAELYYRDALTTDYFRAEHLIEYRYEADGTYDVNCFRLITPIYDL